MFNNRRKFLASAVAVGVASAASALPKMPAAQKIPLVHHVFFWLKNLGSKEDLNKLIEGITTLKKIETLRHIKIGIPAATEKRDVVDASYSISLLAVFDDVKGHDAYQVHPIHTKFVADYSPLWGKVVIYDSQDLS